MEAKPESDCTDGAATQPPSLSATEKEALRKQLNLSPEQEEQLCALTEEQQNAWYEVVRSWSAPAARLAAINSDVRSRQRQVPAIHVPTAEGVATYRGIFGGNGTLTAKQKRHVCRLLENEIGVPAKNGDRGVDDEAGSEGIAEEPEGDPPA